VANAVVVSFHTTAATFARVEFGPDTSYGMSTPLSADADADHDVALLGLPTGETAHYRVVVSTEDGTLVYGEDHTVDVDEGPSTLPELDVMTPAAGAWGDWTLTTFDRVGDTVEGGAMILDAAGNIVWYYLPGDGFVFSAELTPDGTTVVLLITNQSDPEDARVEFVALDGSSVEQFPTPRAHHALAIAPVEGVRFAYIASVVEEWEGSPVVGDRIVEVADDGTEREVWNAFDHLLVIQHDQWENGFYPDGADWTHANGLSYDADSDTYVVSLYYEDTVVDLARSTGDTVWQFGFEATDFVFMDDVGFAHQHAPELHGDTLYLFDNNVGGTPSRLVEYQLDAAQHTARAVWEWTCPEGARVGVLGDVDVLPTGQVASAWGDMGQLAILDRDGSIAERIDVEAGVISPTIQQFQSFYP
jgi:hypothetical protein